MEITTEKIPDLLIARLNGRLDSTWCPSVLDALTRYVKAGEHRIRLDMSAVSYVSSTGLRVLLSTFKQLKAVNGRFSITPASAAVTDTLTLAGMDMLLASEPVALASPSQAAAPAVVAQPFSTSGLRGEVFTLPPGPALKITAINSPAPGAAPLVFSAATFGLGIGALGAQAADCEGRRGEFLAAGGCAAYQPTDGANRPDFVVSEGALVPQAHLLSGLMGTGAFTKLLRFEAPAGARSASLTALGATVLDLGAADAAAFVAVTESAGLVGATLRRDPGNEPASAAARFAFPQIRDWLSFTGERSFRDTTALLVGVVARPGFSGPLAAQLRPLSADAHAPLGHVHALVVPYRPLQKGLMDLVPMVSALFEGAPPQGLLHLLGDPRGLSGAGESDFIRGAVWLAPFTI